MNYDILDQKRKDILPLLKAFKEDFYLAGGTGLALQIGHRDSTDFDFFSEKIFDTRELYLRVSEIFSGHEILKTQEEAGTLTVFLDDSIKISFFHYPYKLIGSLVYETDINFASIEDIACMKLAAIVSRATNKDYIDLFFFLKNSPLSLLLEKMTQKLPGLDKNLVLKSLVYFKDIIIEPIRFVPGNEIEFEAVKRNLEEQVKKIAQ